MREHRVTARAARPAARALGLLVVVGGLTLPTAPAYAVDYDCAAVDEQTGLAEADLPSKPLAQLEVAAAQEAVPRIARGASAGAGVAVAVLDSGVYNANPARLDVSPVTYLAAGQPILADYHGTAVAGLIAGGPRADGTPLGIAPAASIVDVKVYDTLTPDLDQGQVGLDPAAVLRGLTWVRDNAAALGIRVVNVSLAFGDAPGMAEVVGQLWDAGVIVVAPAGNRPTEETDPLFAEYGTFAYDEDAAGAIFPAGYEHVVAVSATVEGYDPQDTGEPIEPSAVALQNSDTDVAAPSADAVTVSRFGGTCTLAVPATSWSTAEVSGVLAMLVSAYPDETPAQLVARLVRTADGREDLRTLYYGAGVVQPYDALVRPLAPDTDGTLAGTTIPLDPDLRAEPPVAEADVLAGTRHDAVWWGLLGGGALVLAVVLRPVLLARRRR